MKFFVTGVNGFYKQYERRLVENGFEPLPTWQDAVGRYLKEAEL